jgi:hypothetical protein
MLFVPSLVNPEGSEHPTWTYLLPFGLNQLDTKHTYITETEFHTMDWGEGSTGSRLRRTTTSSKTGWTKEHRWGGSPRSSR